MVLQKRVAYGSSGNQEHRMPQVPRSARGKRSARKKTEENEMCAFDLLATVAGQLLETENSIAPFSPTIGKVNVKQEQLDERKTPEARTYNRRALGSGQGSSNANDHSQTSNSPSRCSSVFVKADSSEKNTSAGKSTISGKSVELGHPLATILEKCSTGRSMTDSMEPGNLKIEDSIKTLLQAEPRMSGNVIHINASGMQCMEDQMDVDAKPPALVSSESSVEVPPGGVHTFNNSIPKCGDSMEDVVVRHDDDDNSSGCTHPSTTPSKAFRPQRAGGRRIRKLLGSKYWKASPTTVKDREFSDTEMKPVYRGRRMGYTRQRTQRCTFKRVKQIERHTMSVSDAGMCMEANGASSSTTGQNGVGDLHVQFSIKSFKVPELFIEIPETATVGSLKRTVMEAVTAVLGSGLRIGVVHQGKKLRDDNKTLFQAGISHDEKQENMGFTLEPNSTQAPPPLATLEDGLLLPSEQITRIPAVVPPPDQGASSATLQPPLATVVNCPESDHDSVHSPADVSSLDKTDAYTNALIPIPTTSSEPLDVVPLRKSRRAELVQRRIRRPFSVSEVEALVQAVEKLGTGRWRDVKIRAFDNAKHRTYVDLKDKWKTLVHTARISPQQRRGEPVPQILLDRVLAAHAFWTQQQAKLQIKSASEETRLLL